jgi:hypothetical protein
MKNGIEKRGGETRRDRGISARSPEGEVDVKKIEKIDRKVARVLGDDLVEALKEFAEERGLAVTRGNGTIDHGGGSLTTKIILSVVDEDGNAETPEASASQRKPKPRSDSSSDAHSKTETGRESFGPRKKLPKKKES